MAFQAYIQITGAKQGKFKGEGVQTTGLTAGLIPLVRFASGAVAVRDASSGAATGRRQWQPIRITKQWGAASPQLLQALTTNELLSSVVCEFFRTDKAGKEQLHYRITLKNAFVSSITSTLDLTGPTGTPYAGHELEDVEFTFQSVTVEDVADKTTATDNWHEISPQPQPVPPEPIRPVVPA